MRASRPGVVGVLVVLLAGLCLVGAARTTDPVQLDPQLEQAHPLAATGRLDPNTASLEQLQALPGVGPSLAERVVETRTQAPFASAEDLQRVRGIGPKTAARLEPLVEMR